jgi:hypothetical protein
MQKDCAMLSNSSNLTAKFHKDRVQYSGIHFEARFLDDFSVTQLTASESEVSSLNHSRICVGAETLAGVEIGFVTGTQQWPGPTVMTEFPSLPIWPLELVSF